ncbi:MAG: hypothetical protein JWM33_2924 [Caulobacteraceae bacterium]|nr:hypothetical protein [Caulobacteraceae bacterium]
MSPDKSDTAHASGMDRDEAKTALREIGAHQRRGFSMSSYRHAAPYIFMVGVMWLVADLTQQFQPNNYYVWPLGGLFCFLCGLALAYREGKSRAYAASPGVGQYIGRVVATWIFAILFCMGTFRIFAPSSGAQGGSFIGMLLGTIYACMGLWMGWRILAVGLFLAVMSLGGYLWVHEYYSAYMGIVGGGGLILSALWLRRV